MSDIQTIETKRAEAAVDVVCVEGLTIRKGQRVTVSYKFCRDWPAGGFRTLINGVFTTNGDAHFDCFKSASA